MGRRIASRRDFLRLLPLTPASACMASSLLTGSSEDCPASDELALIVAPAELDHDWHERLAEIIADVRGPEITADGPTPSGMFRLRIEDRTHCTSLRKVARDVLEMASQEFPVEVVGADVAFAPGPEIPHTPSGLLKAFSPDAKPDYLGLEFELLGVKCAWARTSGDPQVVVAIIDDGMQLNHPLLEPNLWSNRPEHNGRSKHDDGANGVVDDLHGADFSGASGTGVAYQNSPNEQFRHGTDAAFVAAGRKSQSEACSGVAPDSTLLPVKFYTGGNARDFDLARSIEYAAVSGASIANVSCAIPRYLHACKRAIDFAATHGVLVVVAAGNDTGDLDEHQLFPAAFSLNPRDVPNQIVVMSARNDFSAWQTYSAEAVHLAAPFIARVPADMNGRSDDASGSSIAAPYVAGVAALVKSLNRDWWNYARLRDHLVESGTEHAELIGRNKSGRRVHAERAVLGPIVLPSEGEITWDSSQHPRLRWNMRYDSTTCTSIVVELLADGFATPRVIGNGTAQSLETDLDVREFSNKRGHFRVRSIGSNFQSDWLPVTVL
jgi:subtilisin family serine protease